MEHDQPIEPQDPTLEPTTIPQVEDVNTSSNPTRFLLVLLLPTLIMLVVLVTFTSDSQRDVMLHGLDETEAATQEVTPEITPEIEVTPDVD